MPALTSAEARERFASARIAHLGTIDEASRPHLVPVVFALDGDTVVLAVDHKPKRTTRLKRLANIAANPSVCLLVDRYEEDWDRLWWVRADGEARVLPSPDRCSEAARCVGLLRAKYRQYAEHPPDGPVVEVSVLRWSGWRAS
ncbi:MULTISPECIES: TIGR03668 family PPOX class F420-dependent oxidoreductase [Streptomyces]|jgi:PPOX class probable F420-dependent enzyme|uniref:TIGR03668 family PPOX class F420-dependent oxidoreductase n=1 Tax=unclassified Streptomyces TaxID=2593676 RepID=UPI00088C088C|nr:MULTISPECIES: TIGR03668 family PPOX class F420-dependent oxidoreductase [unclassified Streptomyces]MDX2730333.1 TIGR03668 family PPOX class F420-dependent oxidoreductase [Streptomyces sp. PA03-2a]MDX3769018.1 TIGR03668 family PPOX class F420-dependent oxidoreductase [Streptomyces sp. AK08-01B]MDX3815578.1 TIGR03668 family PPOX class F420-dependent oxidoreductase [Streptomyces sp. AK08-01A]SCX98300.1 PPOX class probable F420-dependent enzyme, Rv0121 family [Streptomyces sp. 136MFCol5.1]SFS39